MVFNQKRQISSFLSLLLFCSPVWTQMWSPIFHLISFFRAAWADTISQFHRFVVLFQWTGRKRSNGTEQRKERSLVKEQEIHHCMESRCRTFTTCAAISLLYLCGLHLSNGFWQVGGDFCQSLSSAVYYVVAAGAGLWTLQHTACRRWWRVVA